MRICWKRVLKSCAKWSDKLKIYENQSRKTEFESECKYDITLKKNQVKQKIELYKMPK